MRLEIANRNRYGLSQSTETWEQKPDVNWLNPGFPHGDDHPVVCVSLERGAGVCELAGPEDSHAGLELCQRLSPSRPGQSLTTRMAQLHVNCSPL